MRFSDLPWTLLLTRPCYSGPVFMFLAEWSKSEVYVGQQKQGHRQLQSWRHFNQNPRGIQRGLRAWLHFSESTICTGSLVNKNTLCTVQWMGNGSMSDSAWSPSAHRPAWWPRMAHEQWVRKAEWDREQRFVVNTNVGMKEHQWACGTERQLPQRRKAWARPCRKDLLGERYCMGTSILVGHFYRIFTIYLLPFYVLYVY